MRPVHLLRLAIVLAFALAAAAVFGQPAAMPASSAAAVVVALPAASPAAPAAQADPTSLLPNGRQPLPGVLTGGQPSAEHLDALATAGYRVLVNLRTDAEAPPAIEERARALGVQYVHLPIASVQDLTSANAAALGKLLVARATSPVVIYCASGNRAAALLAIEQAEVEGKTAADALAIGKAAGLTHLEPDVRERLGLPPS